MTLPAVLLCIATAALAQTQAADQQSKPETLPAAAAESPVPAAGNWLTGSVDIGYRWAFAVHGSYPEYRSTVNLGAGPRLIGLDFTISDPNKRLFDRLDVRAYNWGDPYNTARIDASKLGIYDFSFDYRSIVYFDNVPSYANPAAPAGFDEQSFDVLWRTMSFDLTLLPGRHVVPYLGYWRNSGRGNGIDTWVEDANDEFAVPVLLRDSTDNYDAGLRFEYNRFHLTLEEGGTTFKDDDQSNFSGSSPGDRTTPLLGQSLALNSLQQIYGIRGNGTYSKILATARPTSWIDLYAQFLFSQPKVAVQFDESAAGNFALLSSLLFYSGQQTVGTGAANQPHASANAGFELRPWRRLRLVESWMTDRYHDAASPVVAEQLVLTPPAPGQSVLTALNFSQAVNYNQQQVEAYLDLTPKITLRAGYRYVWGNATALAGELSQSGSLESGTLRRNVALAGFHFRPSGKLSLNLEYEGASSDHIYFRTSLNDYERGRARAHFQPWSSLSFQANFLVLNNQNPDPGIRLDFQARDSMLALIWTPGGGKRVAVTGEYDRSTLRSNISYLTPQFLTPADSLYRDNAHTGTAAIDLNPTRLGFFAPKVTLGGSVFLSSGSHPSRFYQPMARVSFPLAKHLSGNAEWLWYGFAEQFYLYEGFRTHMLLVTLKLNR